MGVSAVDAYTVQLPETQLSLTHFIHSRPCPEPRVKGTVKTTAWALKGEKDMKFLNVYVISWETDESLGYWSNQASPDRTAIIGHDSATVRLKYLGSWPHYPSAYHKQYFRKEKFVGMNAVMLKVSANSIWKNKDKKNTTNLKDF